ncbi:Aste57867_14295 [Aphanomyces stellatus]|uniref:Aste57867_14295 protein n=1 Tax=Aphanomyces stellatus TaxID=120398 RepID=A0A485L132_9STRA|nr:hypothetical protein As57867_014243 [Aphanomyces stellatus]VFT91120.1 Aste57867_14295 [Aphanomyces stellatus]
MSSSSSVPPPSTTDAASLVDSTIDTNPDKAILWSMAIYLSIFVTALLLFEVVRTRLPARFNCRAQDPKQYCPAAQQSYGFLGWIWPLLHISDDETVEFCGLDALVFLRFLRLGRRVALAATLLSAALVPIYATAVADTTSDRSTVDVVTRFAMANMNVKLDPNRMWAPTLAGAAIMVATLILVRQEWQVYVARRHEFLRRDGLQQYTVMIDDLPRRLRTPTALDKYMRALFPDKIDAVVVALECRHVEKQIRRRVAVVTQLERAMLRATMDGRPTKVRVRGARVDAVAHYRRELDALNQSIPAAIGQLKDTQQLLFEQMNDESLEDAAWVATSSRPSSSGQVTMTATMDKPETRHADEMLKCMRPTAFVSFKSLQATQSALQMLQTDSVSEMRMSLAPDPNDLVWRNVGRTLDSRNLWSYLSFVLTTAVVVVWTAVTVATVSLSNIDQLRQKSTTLDALFDDHPWLVVLFKQLAPLGLVLSGAVVSHVFAAITRHEGHASQTQVDAATFAKLVYFHFFHTFVVALCAGSLVSTLQVLTDKPFVVVQVLSQAVPQQASLYISLLLILVGITLVLDLFRLRAALGSLVYHACAPRLTPRDRRSPWLSLTPMTAVVASVDQRGQLPSFFLALLLVLVFCPITPVVSWFGLLVFTAADVVYRRLFFFIVAPNRFTTGVYWPQMYRFIVYALYVAQILLVGMLWIRVSDAKSPNESVRAAYWFAMAPAIFASTFPLITFVVDRHLRRTYPAAAQCLPLVDCCRIDAIRSTNVRLCHDGTVYIQPALLAGRPLASEIYEPMPTIQNTHDDVVGDLYHQVDA